MRPDDSPLRLCDVCVGFRLAVGGECRYRLTESRSDSVVCAVARNLMVPLSHPPRLQDSDGRRSINWPVFIGPRKPDLSTPSPGLCIPP